MAQQELADLMSNRGHKFHQATVYKILRGSRKVSLDEALDIADIFGADIEEMTLPPHEAVLQWEMIRARDALLKIVELTSLWLSKQRNIHQLLGSREDWDPARRKAAEAMLNSGGPEEAVRRGRQDWDNRQKEEPPIGEHPEAPER